MAVVQFGRIVRRVALLEQRKARGRMAGGGAREAGARLQLIFGERPRQRNRILGRVPVGTQKFALLSDARSTSVRAPIADETKFAGVRRHTRASCE